MMDRKDETRKAYADRDDIKGHFLCKWLKDMMQSHAVLEVLSGEHYEKDLIKDFRKAMEGQE